MLIETYLVRLTFDQLLVGEVVSFKNKSVTTLG